MAVSFGCRNYHATAISILGPEAPMDRRSQRIAGHSMKSFGKPLNLDRAAAY